MRLLCNVRMCSTMHEVVAKLVVRFKKLALGDV